MECTFLAFIIDLLSSKLVFMSFVENKSSYNIFISLDIPEAIVCLLPLLKCKAETCSHSSIKVWSIFFKISMLVT